MSLRSAARTLGLLLGATLGAPALAQDAPAAATPPAAAMPVKSPSPDAALDEILDHGRFHGLHLLKPAGNARNTALLFSGRQGWDRQAQAYAQTLRDDQTLVAGIDTPRLLAEIGKDGDDCEFLDGDLENLSRFIQAYTHQDDYLPPLLFGMDDAAALVFGVLSQAPPKSFSGGVGIGFCPRSVLHPPLCAGTALRQRKNGAINELLPGSRLQSPFVAIATPAAEACGVRAFIDKVPDAELRWPMRRRVGPPSAGAAAFVAYSSLAADIAPPFHKSDALPDLPLVEIPATGHLDRYPDTLAILFSGDGGWAGIDEDVADKLAAAGIPVVGVDSLRYFWSERKPETLAADIERLITHYTAAWKRPRVLLIGYSQGADVLPFGLNLLSPAARDHLALSAAVALSEHAAFEFHVGAWAGASGDMPTMPEVQKLADRADFLVICGQDDEDAICPKLDAKHFRFRTLPGSHHFDGVYDDLTRALLDGLPAKSAAAK